MNLSYATRSAPLPPASRAGRAACVSAAPVFQHPLVEQPPRGADPGPVQRRAHQLSRQATEICRSCPLVAACLVTAVLDHDVAGIAGGTTAAQRQAIRRQLQVVVAAEDFETLAGVVGSNRQVDHAEVLRLRTAHPDETLEVLARRLGCSLSTVKRHLRRERHEPGPVAVPARRPSVRAVLAAAAEVTSRGRTRIAA